MKTGEEIDFDDKEEIANIQNIFCDEDHFYVLSNKRMKKLGYYLFSVSIHNPNEDSRYLINWENKLDIANCDLYLLQNKSRENK
jgi:hypothetical protein